MGSWYETCALTSLPVVDHDECYMVHYSREGIDGLAREETLPTSQHLSCVKGIYFGKYGDYGWLEDLSKAEEFGQKYMHRLFTGQEIESTINMGNIPRAFFKKEAWEWGVKEAEKDDWGMDIINRQLDRDARSRETLEDDEHGLRRVFMGDDLLPDHLDRELMIEYMKVMFACYLTRKDLFAGNRFTGHQQMEMEPYEGLNKLTAELIEARKKEMAEW